jgi:hypothetical protein
MEALINGTAGGAGWVLAAGVVVLFLSFYSIFLGAGLYLLQKWFVLGLLLALVPGVWVYRALIGPIWADYRQVKGRSRAGSAASLHPPGSSTPRREST